MKPKLLYLFVGLLVFASCKKTDQKTNSGSLPTLIESISLADYPLIECQVRADTTPYLINNRVNLPYQALLQPIKVRIKTINGTRMEVIQTSKNGTTQSVIYTLEPDSKEMNIEIMGLKPVTVKLFNKDFLSEYTIRLKENQMADPDFKSFSLNIDPNNRTPLAGILSVSSSAPVTVKYIVKGQDGEDFSSQSSVVKTDNQINIFGLYPNTKNQVRVIITNAEGSTASKDIYIATGMLPKEFPDSADITVSKLEADARTKFILYYPYKTIGAPFNNPGNMAYPIVLDNHGKVRWYMTSPFVMDMKPMSNGHFLLYYYNYIFQEVDLLGNVYKEIFPKNKCHHDFELLPNGNILYTGEDVSVNNTYEDKIYELDYQTGTIVKTINLYDILDPSRPQQPFIARLPTDWFHNNSVTYDAVDNSIIVTGRHQSAICKIDYATNQLKWIIADSMHWKSPWSNVLLKPMGGNFEFAWGLHSAVLNPLDHNKLIIFDNGNDRSYTNPLTPPNSYSRVVEFSINENTSSVSQTFDFGKEMGADNYSPALGNVDYVKDNLFVCFPLIVKDINGRASNFTGTPSVRLMEVDRNKKVMLDMRIRNNSGNPANGYRTYRAHPFNFTL